MLSKNALNLTVAVVVGALVAQYLMNRPAVKSLLA